MSRSNRHFQTLATRWAAAALATILSAPATGQDPAPPVVEPLSVEVIEAKIIQLEANTALEEGIKNPALEAMREAVAKLKLAATHEASAAGHRKMIEDGPGALNSVRTELKEAAPPLEPGIDQLRSQVRVEVEAELTREQARLTTLQRTVEALSTEIGDQQGRPTKIREEMATATTRLQQIESELKNLDEPNEILREARTLRTRARKLARSKELEALQQEQLVNQVRSELLAARRDLALQALGVSWSHVQWLVAALSVGLGFGLQEIFANFISGVIILVERPIRVGDTVTIGAVSGTVTRIRIRATTITDWDQKELVVPNKSFITGELINWSLSNPVTRLIVNVGIAYGSDTELALRLMMNAAQEHPKAMAEPESAVFFVGFGDSALNFEVRVFVKELSNRARTTIVHDLHLAIDRAFREHGVVIAFPQRDIHIKSETLPAESPVQKEPQLDPRAD